MNALTGRMDGCALHGSKLYFIPYDKNVCQEMLKTDSHEKIKTE